MGRFRISTPEVIHETLEGEVVIVNLKSGSYYRTAGSGAAIWGGLERAETAGEIVARLSASYGAEGNGVDKNVRGFLQELEEEGLIARSDAEPAGESTDAAPPSDTEEAFEVPVLEKFDDMQEMILLDPVHEVDERGWPYAKPRG